MGDDFQEQFRAAKAARGAGKLTKEQLKALRVQKAAAAAAAAAAAPPPAAPAPPAAAAGAGPAKGPGTRPTGPATFHPDSQATLLNGGGGVTAASLLHSEPSVNKATAQHAQQGDTAAANATSLGESNAIPAGFFEAVAPPQGQGSTSGPPGQGLRGARSAEGSTGGVADGGGELPYGSINPADLATSAFSGMPGAGRDAGAAAAESVQAGGGGPLPAGFFDGPRSAQLATKASAATDADQEFADFMKEVGGGGAGSIEGEDPPDPTVTEATGGEDEEDEDARHEREDFEQFVRMERLREVRDAAERRAAPPEGGSGGADAEAPASALEIAGIAAEAPPPPKLVLPKKRKVSETVAMLHVGGSDSDGDDEDDGAALDMNWRAKKSVA